MLREPLTPVLPPPVRQGSRRRWRDKFRAAFRGVKLGVRGHSSFSVHLFAAAAALVACLALHCRVWEWCAILLCIGGVSTAELFSSAIDTLSRGPEPDTRARRDGCLDIAAGAVLTASLFSALVGALVFVNRFGELMRWWD